MGHQVPRRVLERRVSVATRNLASSFALLLIGLVLCAPARADDEADRAAAKAALLKGDHATAIAALTRVAAANPNDALAQRELGFALQLANREAEAVPVLERARKLAPNDAEVLLQLARALSVLGKIDEAIEAWERAALGAPRHPLPWRSLAHMLLQRDGKGDRERALRALELGTRECADDEALLLMRAEALLISGEKEQIAAARKLLEVFADRKPEALESGRRLAALLAAMGEHAAAAARLEKVLARAPLEGPYRDLLEAERALHQWDGAARATPAPGPLDAATPGIDLPVAARRLDLLLRARNEDGALLLARARIELRMGIPEAALPWLEQAALVGPEKLTADALLLQEVANAQKGAGEQRPRTYFNPEVSPAKARRLVYLMAWEAAAHETLGRALEREGDLIAAAEAYDQAAARAAGDEEKARIATLAAAARAAEDRRKRNAGM